jgi:amidophosphoribosyltransferase
MPQHQDVRDLVARMKLITIKELIEGKRFLFCEDSIVRGTQLKDTIQRLYDCGATEIHMRPACPPLVYGCKFLNFSRSRSEMDLASRQAVRAIEGPDAKDFNEYTRAGTSKYNLMEEWIGKRLNLTTLKYQVLEDLIAAIGLPKEKLCTFCWDGSE